MHSAFKNAALLCKTLMRNGFDAHIINAPMQELLIENGSVKKPVIDLACEADFENLARIFPEIRKDTTGIAILNGEDVNVRFYQLDTALAGHPELCLLRLTPTMLNAMEPEQREQIHCSGREKDTENINAGFVYVKDGSLRFLGVPDLTLSNNYLLAIRALRFAANYDVNIEPNTWMAIVRAASRILDYVPISEIMEEWKKVSAESMYRFVKLLYDSHLLHGLIPEIANLSSVIQQTSSGEISGNALDHTLKCMELYPQDNLNYDWLGAFAMLFHDIGKLYTAEYFNGRWTYFQHHQVGAKVTRKILRRLGFNQQDTDLICTLVNNHMRFHFMMTDQGIRKFNAISQNERLIAMAKADILSRNDSFTSFNHNLKYLERADTPREMLEPLLNGNEIMNVTCLSPGKIVGMIRDALLNAQKSGQINTRDEAEDFVKIYVKQLIQ